MSRITHYPDYQSSSVDWIDRYPLGWKVARLSRVLAGIKDGTHGTFQRVEEGHPLLSAKNVQAGKIYLGDAESKISEEDYKSIISNGYPQAGDVALTIVGSVGRSAVYDLPHPVAFQRSVCFLRTTPACNPYFLNYQIQADAFQEQLKLKTKVSAQPGVYMGDVASIGVVVPELEDQKAIVNFLDQETAEIDAFIADQEFLINLLNERRSANIAHVVTKGLNSNAPLRETGIEWLGRIPSHWQAHGLKYAAKTISGSGFPHAYQGSTEEEYAFHKVNSLSAADPDGVIRIRRETVSAATAVTLRAEILPSGSIVLAKIGAALLLGRIRMLGMPSCIDNNMLGIKLTSRAHPRFTYYALHLVTFPKIVNPGAVPSLNERAFRSFELAWPPYHEQQAIADVLDRECSQLDAAIDDAREAIRLSQERRAALISAAVTGKIDVRDWKGSTERALESHGVA